MEPKLVSEHLHTKLTRPPIRRPPLREDPTGDLQNAAEGPWSRLSLTVSLSSLHERGSDEGKRNMQAEDHASRMLYLPIVEETYLSSRTSRAHDHVVVSWSADRHEMPPLHACSSFPSAPASIKIIY
jgi:hypothetical protein